MATTTEQLPTVTAAASPTAQTQPVVVSTSMPAQQDVNTKMSEINSLASSSPSPYTSTQLQARTNKSTAPKTVTRNMQAEETVRQRMMQESPNANTSDASTGKLFNERVYTEVYGTPNPSFSSTGAQIQAPTTSTSTQNGTTTGGSTTGAPTSALDQYAQEVAALNEQADVSYQDYLNKANQIMNGTYPLSASEQAQIDAITKQYQQLVEQQRVANKNYEGAIRQTGIAAGRNIYAPEVEWGNVNAAVSAGISAISRIEADMASAVSEAQAAFQAQDFEQLNAVYSQLQQHTKDRRDAIADVYDKTRQALIDEEDRLSKQFQQGIDTATLLGQSGLQSSQVDPAVLAANDKKLGVPGITSGLIDTNYKATQAKTQSDQLAAASSMADLLSKMKPGMPPVTIGDTSYAVVSASGGKVNGVEVSKNGTYLWSKNNATGEVSAHMFDFGTDKLANTYNVDGKIIGVREDGTSLVIYDNSQINGGVASTPAIDAEFPEGSYYGECGYFTHEITEIPRMGDTFKSKMSVADKSLSPEIVGAGDVFVMEAGSTGHVGVILSSTLREDGSFDFQTIEANANGDGVVHRQVRNSKAIKGYINGTMKQEFANGPDSTTADPTVDAYARDFLAGRVASGNIPANIRNQVINEASKIRAQFTSTPEVKAMSNIGGLSADAKLGYETSLMNALESGDTSQAQSILKNAVYDGANTTTQAKLDGREQVVSSLSEIQNAFDEYVAKNGDTNIFKGSINAIARKVGSIKDPALESIATRIQSALIDYRNAVSGAAFTESELKQYNKLFPSDKNIPSLNKVIIDTLIDQFSDNTENFYRKRMGTTNYDAIFGNSSREETNSSSATQDNASYDNKLDKLFGF